MIMETCPLVTIAVAAYNVEKWLHECLDSILKQTYQNWECIIVNDGSKDKTRNIALEFCARDTRFKLINQENGGLSVARNTGLDNARGDFVYFVDGDDMLTEDCIEYCVNSIGKSDVMACDCIAITETGRFIRQTNQGVDRNIDRSEALKWTLDRRLMTSVWSKFYRRNVIGNLKFNEALWGGQDMYFNTELLLLNPNLKVRGSTHPIYKYRYINSSVSHIRNKARVKRLYTQIEEMECLYETHKATINQECLDEFARNIIRDLLYHYALQGVIKKTDVSLLPLMRKWHALLIDKSSNEFLRTKFVEKEMSVTTDIMITLKYLPQTIREYVKSILWKTK